MHTPHFREELATGRHTISLHTISHTTHRLDTVTYYYNCYIQQQQQQNNVQDRIKNKRGVDRDTRSNRSNSSNSRRQESITTRQQQQQQQRSPRVRKADEDEDTNTP